MKSCNPMHSLQPRDPGGNHMRKMPRWHMQMDIMCIRIRLQWHCPSNS